MTQRNLVTVDGWTTAADSQYMGPYRDELGHGLSGFYRRDYRYRQWMHVMNNGHSLARYMYPRVDIAFQSPMVRWQNLLFCGGYSVRDQNDVWTGSNEQLLKTVADGLKPVGFINIPETQLEEWLERISYTNVYYAVNPGKVDGRLDIGITSARLPLDVVFDIDSLLDSYEQMGGLLGTGDEMFLRRQSTCLLTHFIRGWDFIDASCYGNRYAVLNGLILGYPLDSTVAFVCGDIV